jgi:hypothetical protein
MITRNNFRFNKLRIVIFTISLFIYLQSFGQKFIVTPDGIRDSSNIEKSYVVIEIEGKSAKQLFDNAKRYIIQTYKNPDFVQKGIIDNEYIKFDTYVPYIATINTGLSKLKYDAKYVTELYFKDGKVKLEVVNLEIMTVGVPLNFKPKGALGGWYVFNSKGLLKQENAKREIENYFNELLTSLSAYLKGSKDNKDW